MQEVVPPEVSLPKEVVEKIGHGGLTFFQDRDFVEAILQDRQPVVNVYEAARSCAAALCARQSALEGRPVRIPSFFQKTW